MLQHEPLILRKRDEPLRLADITQHVEQANAKTPAEVVDVVTAAKAGIDALRRKLDDLEKQVLDQAADTSWSMSRLASVGANANAECKRIGALIEQWARQLPPPRT